MKTLIEAIIREKVSDRLVWVDAGATVAEAVRRMAEERVGATLVKTEDGLFGGIFTERDLLVRVVNQGLDPATTPISMVMTSDVRFVTRGTTVEAALALMHVKRHRHLLVIDGPTVHGLVSTGDLIRHLIEHGEGRFEAAVRDAAPPKAN